MGLYTFEISTDESWTNSQFEREITYKLMIASIDLAREKQVKLRRLARIPNRKK